MQVQNKSSKTSIRKEYGEKLRRTRKVRGAEKKLESEAQITAKSEKRNIKDLTKEVCELRTAISKLEKAEDLSGLVNQLVSHSCF